MVLLESFAATHDKYNLSAGHEMAGICSARPKTASVYYGI
jgi:hypothetical protein